MEIVIKCNPPADPKARVLLLESVTRSIYQASGQDPAEGVMMLLTAAVHMSMTYSGRSVKDTALVLAECLGSAIVAADGFFTLREVNKNG